MRYTKHLLFWPAQSVVGNTYNHFVQSDLFFAFCVCVALRSISNIFLVFYMYVVIADSLMLKYITTDLVSGFLFVLYFSDRL